MFTLDPMSWSIKEVIARRTRQSDYIALTLSLSHMSSIILNFGVAPGIRKAELGALYMPKSDKADSSPKAEKIFKDLRPLEQRPALAAS